MSFQIFQKRWKRLDFSHKKGGTGKIWGCYKRGDITYFHTNPFQYYLPLSIWCAYLCFVYLHQYYLKNLALKHLINRYMTFPNCWKDIVESNFLYISELSIQHNKDSCCKYIAGCVNIYLHGCVSLLAPECAVCVCVCVCVCVSLCVWYQIRVAAENIMYCTSVTLTPCCIKHKSRSFWY